MALLLFFAFLSGIVTILSPCILPILPIVLSGSVGGKKRPLGVVIGFVASFTLFTLILSTIVQAFNISPDALRVVAVIIIVLFGVVLLIPWLQDKFEIFASRLISKRKQRQNGNGFWGGVVLGTSLGIVWTPCVGPIMASVISLAITQSVDGASVFIILTYSLGTALPMFGVMFGGRKLIEKFSFLSNNLGKMQRVFGVVMILVGLAIATGVDRRFQSAILTIFPNYGSGLTAIEENEAVRKALDTRESNREENESYQNSMEGDSMMMMESGEGDAVSLKESLSWDNRPESGVLGDYGEAPEILTEGPWFNIEGIELTMEELKGKVILVDFWTYSCINCIRTIPHLKSWYDAYKDEGLVIIGVHTPEFEFERSEQNVKKAMADFGVTWPVVLDNKYLQWRAYHNRYWPAHYFIDAEGRIRYFHYGEGEYDSAEKVIRELLDEAGKRAEASSIEVEDIKTSSNTRETYLGYKRTESFNSDKKIVTDEVADYSLARNLKNGEWSLGGRWIFKKEFVVFDGSGASDGDGVLELGFQSQDVYLVIEPEDQGSNIEVLVDGKISGNTKDVQSGVVRADTSRLYHLVHLPEKGEHKLTLKVDGKLRLFAFTFG